ncbi:hypothetical protein M6B38_153335 [Iris pallida]|uniref:Uncharacterized protein n=1 Tax=Iris pallida TaxID=29817 RepID=A0AAX6EQD7_IRIPA|nr:hypothetical protein M6B38_176465 [Iris pallida]KAJ6811572.1 hypothetical protein M6B38_153335 [Iris pallida]
MCELDACPRLIRVRVSRRSRICSMDCSRSGNSGLFVSRLLCSSVDRVQLVCVSRCVACPE